MAPSVEHGLRDRARARARRGRAAQRRRRSTCSTGCSTTYRQAADAVDELGLESWPKQIVHADWHPGNMLFRDNHVVAVIDYDSAR